MFKLKCWERTTNYATVQTYKKVRGENKQTISVGEMNEYDKRWGVVISYRKKNQKVLAEDTTKANATKIAQKYMKDHDRC